MTSIAILTSGTRGDVQPLIALGRGLRAAGNEVRLVTHERFAPLAAAHNLPFAPLIDALNDLLAQPEWRDALVYNGHPLRTLLATLRYIHVARPLFAQTLRSAAAQCRDADALIVTLPTTWGAQIAEAFSQRCAFALLQPLGETAAFPSPLQPFGGSFGAAYNRLSHRFAERALWRPWRATLNQWRQRDLDLPPLNRAGPLADLPARGVPFLYGISPLVLPRPADWPPQRHMTGYWFLDAPAGWQPPADLVNFMQAGPPPVYVGFGSTGARNEALQRNVLAAIERASVRALLAGATALSLPANVFPCPDVPHDWLFPQVAAVVHHGGAGTSAAALRAGVPAVVVPTGIDQFFWARRINALSCGPAPIPQRILTVDRLADAITLAVNDATIRANATSLGEQIRREDGVQRAVELLMNIWR